MARILLVDDDPSILALERLLLTESGHEVLIANTARDGLNLLKVYQVDLVIVDVQMPELNGFQFVNLLHNNNNLKKTAVAFLSSEANVKNILKAGELGADFYLTKPINQSVFRERIAAYFQAHPPMEFPRLPCKRQAQGEVKIRSSVQLTWISELGAEILTEANLEIDQVIELSSVLFQEIPLKNALLRVFSVKKEEDGLNRVHLMFMNLDSATVQKIQRWISYNSIKSRQSG